MTDDKGTGGLGGSYALTVRQPWASMITDGRKTIELRSWRTAYRGPLVICSGAAVWRGLRSESPRGVQLCEVELVDVRLATLADASAAGLEPPAGWYAWELRLLRELPHEPRKGRLGLWRI